LNRLGISAVFLLFFAISSAALQSDTAAPAVRATSPKNIVVLIVPFTNASKAPGLEWIGEAFAEVLAQRMQSPSIFMISREDRLYAFDRMGIPANARLSRATLLRIAEQMDVDYVVLGDYNYDGTSFTAHSQLLNMRRLHLSPAVTESGSLLQLVDIQAASAWDLLREMHPGFAVPKEEFVAETKDIRLDALENYVRGVIATSSPERIRHFKEAVRLNSNYTVAMLALGKTYFDLRDYGPAIDWFGKIPVSDTHALEANFFLGLAAYYSGNLDRAAQAFRLVAERLPLTEVYNNLGVVEARRGKSDSLEYLQKAMDGDPANADYHFNLAISLARTGDTPSAIRALKEAVNLNPNDGEAKSYLDSLTRAGAARPPLERIKRNYDEASFRQLAFAIQNAQEAQMAHADPKKHAAMHVEEGKQQLREGFYEDARDSFREAASLDPNNGEAHLGLANAEMALNDFAAARSELDAALSTGANPAAYLALAQLDLKEKKFDAANEHLEQALHLQPENAVALQLKQQLAAQSGNAAEAKQ
jgi:tetratricopeptide (TPR) repeat protein